MVVLSGGLNTNREGELVAHGLMHTQGPIIRRLASILPKVAQGPLAEPSTLMQAAALS